MDWKLKVKTAAVSNPITLTDVKNHLRIDDSYTAEDTYLNTLIEAAIDYVEGEHGIGIYLSSQVITVFLDNFYAREICIPVLPVISIDEIRYFDTAEVQQTWAATNYHTDIYSKPARIVVKNTVSLPATQDRPNAVEIDATVGFSTVPQLLKNGLLLMIGHWYENRESVQYGQPYHNVPMTSKNIFGKYAVMAIA